MNKLPKFRSKEILTQDAGKELLIYDLKINKAYCLNETLFVIYQACDGVTTFSELKAKQTLTNEAILFGLDELKRADLLENSANLPVYLTGMSRREAIKRVGLASALAIPLITALSAPLAAQTASGLCIGAGTTLNGSFVQSGGSNYCAPDQATCDVVAARGAGDGGCCSGVAVAVNNNCDGGGTDLFSCQCVAP
jgi:hypothetical protein